MTDMKETATAVDQVSAAVAGMEGLALGDSNQLRNAVHEDGAATASEMVDGDNNVANERVDVWRQKYAQEFGDPWHVVDVLQAAGIDVDFEACPVDWRSQYEGRSSLSDAEMEQGGRLAEKEFRFAEQEITKLRSLAPDGSDFDFAKVVTATTSLMQVVSRIGDHVESYCMLAYLCYFSMAIDEALDLLDIAQAFDNDHPNSAELRRVLEDMREPPLSSSGDYPLTVTNGMMVVLAPRMKTVLMSIFQGFTATDSFTFEDMAQYTKKTSGQEMPRQFWEFLTSSFPTNDQGHLSFEGFCEFYLQQTLSDEEETYSDLQKHGYRRNLQPIS